MLSIALLITLASVPQSDQFRVAVTGADSPNVAFDFDNMRWTRQCFQSQPEWDSPIPGTQTRFYAFLSNDKTALTQNKLTSVTAEARYLWVKGKASFSHLSQSSSTNQAHALTVRFSREYGWERRVIPDHEMASLRAIFDKDNRAFIDDYGTHYISGRVRAHMVDLSVGFKSNNIYDYDELSKSVSVSARKGVFAAGFTAAVSEVKSRMGEHQEFNLSATSNGKALAVPYQPLPREAPQVWLDKILSHMDSVKMDDKSDDTMSSSPVFYSLERFPFLSARSDEVNEDLLLIHDREIELERDLQMVTDILADADRPLAQKLYPHVLEGDRGKFEAIKQQLLAAKEDLDTAIERIKSNRPWTLPVRPTIITRPLVSVRHWQNDGSLVGQVPYIDVEVKGARFAELRIQLIYKGARYSYKDVHNRIIQPDQLVVRLPQSKSDSILSGQPWGGTPSARLLPDSDPAYGHYHLIIAAHMMAGHSLPNDAPVIARVQFVDAHGVTICFRDYELT